MMEERHRRELIHVFRGALSSDRAKTDVVGISKLGLVQMTRERTHRTLESIAYQDCPLCQGKGKVKSPFSIALNAIRDLKNYLAHHRTRRVVVEVHPDVAASLNGQHFKGLRNVSRRFGARVDIHTNKELHPEKINIRS